MRTTILSGRKMAASRALFRRSNRPYASSGACASFCQRQNAHFFQARGFASSDASDRVYCSLFDDVQLAPDMSLTDYVFKGADPNATAFVDGTSGRSISFGEFEELMSRTAVNLLNDGFQEGDVVAIHLPNCPEYGIAFHAVAALGGVCTTVSPLASGDELRKQLNDSKARFILTVSGLKETADNAVTGTSIERTYSLGSSDCFVTRKDGESTKFTPSKFDPKEKIIALPYSSGTTGLPKGTMLTHYNLTSNIAQMLNHPEFFIDFQKGDRVLGVLPFFHIYGMVVVMNAALKKQSTIVTLPKFEPEQFLKTMSNSKVSFAPLVPPIIRFLAKHPMVENYKVDSLRVIFSGAAPLDSVTQEAVGNRLPGTAVLQGYGMTELSPVSHFSHPKHHRSGSVGFLAPNCKCKIVDPSTQEVLSPGEENIGELCIQGPNVMKGYLNNPTATKSAIDKDGFMHTGDLGYVDKDGFYFIVDRLKELIKVKGYQVPPAELEGLLLEHEHIADVAVIGIDDERAGEVPKAFVVKSSEADLSEDDVKDHVAKCVSEYKQLHSVDFVEEIPKSPAGKILRRVLVDQEKQKKK
eukprot:gb/GECG01008935.1/.p1 GENE.gb/GECG01008935.1/~~gb/GECG01008935.1/.p1  ORF type:complete len:581 (+),score=84.53 gb/GECG01008935.1/:1-1743(+)